VLANDARGNEGLSSFDHVLKMEGRLFFKLLTKESELPRLFHNVR
jgi:hypothetical protein